VTVTEPITVGVTTLSFNDPESVSSELPDGAFAGNDSTAESKLMALGLREKAI
jgi:hypothetical protein